MYVLPKDQGKILKGYFSRGLGGERKATLFLRGI
jgi:hypothetical protein